MSLELCYPQSYVTGVRTRTYAQRDRDTGRRPCEEWSYAATAGLPEGNPGADASLVPSEGVRSAQRLDLSLLASITECIRQYVFVV